MITHDVDEAIYLSDKVLLMSNGPDARVAEQVPITLERPRSRAQLAKRPEYYEQRTHLIDFLVERAANGETPKGQDAENAAEGLDASQEEPNSETSLPPLQRAVGGENV